MTGLVCYRTGKEKDGVRTIGRARFYAVYAAEGTTLRARLAADRAARRLKKRGVRQAVFPRGYAWSGRFIRRGVLPADEGALRMEKAAELAMSALARQGCAPEGARVALVCSARCEALARAAERLAPRVRYLTLCTPEGEKLGRALRWDYGVSARLAREEDTADAALAVSFDAEEPRCRCACLWLRGEAVRFSAPLPQGSERWEQGQLIAALFSAGALRAEEITAEVSGERFPDRP